jgi:hypothetical protein
VVAVLDGCNVTLCPLNKKGTSIMSKGILAHRTVIALGLIIATSLAACSPQTGTPATHGAAWMTQVNEARPAFDRVTRDLDTARAESAIMPSYTYNDPDCDPEDPLYPFCAIHRG